MNPLNLREYGDLDRLYSDIKQINDILARQGNRLLIDCIAEHVGTTANKFKLDAAEREKLLKNILNDIEQQITERI